MGGRVQTLGSISGGKAVYGATLGILMLESHFPRVIGDVGNAQTWPFPVQYKVVWGATPVEIVAGDPTTKLDAFVEAGRELVEMGCDGIASTCGFLSLLQPQLSQSLGVPVATSALIQIPMISQMLPPDRHVSVLTISKKDLSNAHLQAANVPLSTPIVGTETQSTGEFTSSILGNKPTLDLAVCKQELIGFARRLVHQHPKTGAIVLECTNMVPFAADIRRATGLPVYSVYSLLVWFQAGLLPRRFPLEVHDPREDPH
jgi:hypothetical protein